MTVTVDAEPAERSDLRDGMGSGGACVPWPVNGCSRYEHLDGGEPASGVPDVWEVIHPIELGETGARDVIGEEPCSLDPGHGITAPVNNECGQGQLRQQRRDVDVVEHGEDLPRYHAA